jgi:hypothetical protein
MDSKAGQDDHRSWYARLVTPNCLPEKHKLDVAQPRGHRQSSMFGTRGAERTGVDVMKGQDELGFEVDPFENAFGQLACALHWPSLTKTERAQAFTDLREWVEQLVDRFAIETRVIPPCWYRHNGMVEALSALRDHERMSFSDHGSPTGAVDWFRAFREIEMRLSDLAARTQCSVQEHRPDPPRAWQTKEQDWSAQLGLATATSRSLADPLEDQTSSTSSGA